MEQRISHTRKTAATFLYRSELLVVLIVLHPEDNEENEPEISNAAHGPMIQTQIPIKHCGLRDLSWSTEQCFDDTHGISEKAKERLSPIGSKLLLSLP
jgi:hypothetical protein